MKKPDDSAALGEALEVVAARAIPEGTDLWPALAARLAGRRPRVGFRPGLPQTRLGWVVLALIMLAVLGATAYAANSSSVLRGLFWPRAGKAGGATELNLSQTVDGVTVNLELAYADTNEVLLGLSVSGPEQDRYWFSGQGGLWTKAGVRLWGVSGIGMGREGDTLGEWRQSERLAEVQSFDGSPIEGAPPQLELHFETYVGYGDRGPGLRTIVGPFVFDFAVPFKPAKDIVIPVGQTVEIEGVTIRLEKVTITATQVQALIWTNGKWGGGPPWDPSSGEDPPSGDSPSTFLMPMLTPPGGWTWKTAPPLGSGTMLGSSGMTRIWFRKKDLPMDRSGEWTLTLQERRIDPSREGMKEVKGPSWVFKFQVP